MYALVAFLITLTELVVILGSYALQSKNIFYSLLVYGSPFYLLMNLLNNASAFLDKSYLYVALLAFHIVKYFIIFRAQIIGDSPFMRYTAIAFEAAYLCLSGYYLN